MYKNKTSEEEAKKGCGLSLTVAYSTKDDPAEAVSEIKSMLDKFSNIPPSFVTIHYNSAYNIKALWSECSAVISAGTLHASSSCRGIMTNSGSFHDDEKSIAALAIWDADGNHGTALELIDGAPRLAATRATRRALENAKRPGEAPDLVWVSACPGAEEEIICGIKDLTGSSTLIVGGSAADNDVSGNWTVFDRDRFSNDAVIISVVFSSSALSCSFESGYAPTTREGIVTQANGRKVKKINDRLAYEVYNEWTKGALKIATGSRRAILMETTLLPIGREHRDIGGIPFYLMAHPAVSHADGSIEFFADIPIGARIRLMHGSSDSLVKRAGHIARESSDKLVDKPIAGALVVYCAGCMLSVTDKMQHTVDEIKNALGDMPFLGVFSFGEQGKTLSGESEHANLMISCVAFAKH
jgi:hypothetical protein